jgi:Protein tyrosine and serine/threonine kinase
LYAAIIEAVASNIQPIFRPDLSRMQINDVSDEFKTLMRHCWSEQPNERPDFDEISKTIRGMTTVFEMLKLS